MYFYCTQKVGNYHKVGISRSFSGIKNRLSDYRQISPKTNIKFFTEIPSSSIEDSFKNKFNHFRIGNSECYRLREDIIFKHVLKYIHKDIQLFGFWYNDRYFISKYYFDKNFFELDFKRIFYTFNKRDIDPYRHNNFICVGRIDECRNKSHEIIKTKTGKRKYIIRNALLDTKKRLSDYGREYNHFIDEIYYSKDLGTRAAQIQRAENFEDDIFENRTVFDHNPFILLEQELFNQIKKSDSRLVKQYTNYIKTNHRGRMREFNWGHYEIRSLNFSREQRILKTLGEDYSSPENILKRQIEKKTYLSKDDFLNYFNYVLDSILGISLYGTDRTKNEYLRALRSILRQSSNNIKNEIDKITFKKNTKKEANDYDMKQVATNLHLEKSINVSIQPWEKGFNLAILERSMVGFKDEEKELCRNIAKGMVKIANDNPHLVYTEGLKASNLEAKKDENNFDIRNLKEKKNVINFNEVSSKKNK